MRLPILDHGHRRRAKVFLWLSAAMSGVESPDIVKLLLYRPGFLGRPLAQLTAAAMRGPSYWTPGEREYLAMRTALSFRCPFCIDTHTELTRIAGDGEIDPHDPDSARSELVAVQGFLAGTGPAAIAGIPSQAVLDALHVGLAFGIINRLANAFGFALRDGQLHTGTRALHRFGYRFPSFLLGGGDATSDAVADLRRATLEAPATTAPALRQAAAAGEFLPEPWEPYTGTVRDASYKIADADIDRLSAAGRTQDEIFEVTCAAAVGAALRRFDAGRYALGY